MLIDCDTCSARDRACSSCVVGLLLETPVVPSPSTPPDAAADLERPGPGELDGPLPEGFGAVEFRALEVLADQGLIPRLRLLPTPTPSAPVSAARERRARDAG